MTEKKHRVLVVDDHPKLLKFIEIDLKLHSYDVITAKSGEEALELITSAKPEIMLLDIVMPGMDGIEVLNQLRKFSTLPVIAFSASPENQEPALQAGADDFLHKPFDIEEMVAKINLFLRNGKTNRD